MHPIKVIVLSILLSIASILQILRDAANAQVSERPDPAVEKIAEGLTLPWAFTFLPDGRILVTELAGRVKVISAAGDVMPDDWLSEDFVAGGHEFTGIAIDPAFTENSYVYVVVAIDGSDTVNDNGKVFENRIYRFEDRDGWAQNPEIIVSGIPNGDFHGGGRLAFGPDGRLYLSTGDAHRPTRSQDLDDLAGKILRFDRDGTIPQDNPIANSPIYASGLRNPQGFAWHPDTRDFFATEHGPTARPGEDGRRHQDELNVIKPGGNYGWPELSGLNMDERFIAPLVEWTPAIAPAGLAIVDRPGSPWDKIVFVAALRGQQLRQLDIDLNSQGSGPTVWTVSQQTPMFRGAYGRIRAVAQSPDGYLYFAGGSSIYRFKL